MTEAARTLVKSPPELWAEVSDAASLARHLGEFGEIRITRLEPESTVAWEGETARGTVGLEPSGWGTKVCLTAEPIGEAPAPEPVAAEPEPPAPEPPAPEPVAAAPEPPLRGLRAVIARMRREREAAAAPPEPEPERQPEPEPPPPPPPPPARTPVEAVLGSALDSLGSAHKRPFSGPG
jgi:hypothetical protein